MFKMNPGARGEPVLAAWGSPPRLRRCSAHWPPVAGSRPTPGPTSSTSSPAVASGRQVVTTGRADHAARMAHNVSVSRDESPIASEPTACKVSRVDGQCRRPLLTPEESHPIGSPKAAARSGAAAALRRGGAPMIWEYRRLKE